MKRISKQLSAVSDDLKECVSFKFVNIDSKKADFVNSICSQIDDLVDRIRRNENLTLSIERESDNDSTSVKIRMSDHEAIKAIKEEVAEKVQKMSRKKKLEVKVAHELLVVSRELMAIDFPSQDALDKYMKEHPDGDRSNHHVVEEQNRSNGEESGEKKVETNKSEKPTSQMEKDSDSKRANDLFSSAWSMAEWRRTIDVFNKEHSLSSGQQGEVLKKSGISQPEADAILSSIDDYTFDSFAGINTMMRDGIPMSKGDKDTVKNVKKYLKTMPKVPSSVPVCRGCALREKEVAGILDSVGKNKEVTLDEKAFSSASLSPTVAWKFTGESKPGKARVMFQIHQKNGVLIGGISHVENEYEVLLPPGKLKVKRVGFLDAKGAKTDKRDINGVVVFDAEEV
jgi:hypothetical protein